MKVEKKEKKKKRKKQKESTIKLPVPLPFLLVKMDNYKVDFLHTFYNVHKENKIYAISLITYGHEKLSIDVYLWQMQIFTYKNCHFFFLS